MRLAWILWLGLLLLTLVVLLSTVYVVHGTPPVEAANVKATRWMWLLVAYFVVVIPLAFLRTGRLFRSYYRYKPVSPPTYIAGMATVWIALTVGAERLALAAERLGSALERAPRGSLATTV